MGTRGQVQFFFFFSYPLCPWILFINDTSCQILWLWLLQRHWQLSGRALFHGYWPVPAFQEFACALTQQLLNKQTILSPVSLSLSFLSNGLGLGNSITIPLWSPVTQIRNLGLSLPSTASQVGSLRFCLVNCSQKPSASNCYCS
jgi:hypothetical protein